MDKLQDKIRKCKNPSVVEIRADRSIIPPHLLQNAGSFSEAFLQYCGDVLEHIKGIVPAVRVRFTSFALHGAAGMELMAQVLALAKLDGFYVILDGPESLSRQDAEEAAGSLFAPDSAYIFDGLVISAYIGSDAVKPYLQAMKGTDRDLFVVVRTGNKSASELQDLLSGTRLVHMAAAEVVSRLGENEAGRTGYSSVGIVAAAGAPDSLKALRTKHEKMFILAEGYDYANANAKTGSLAFDQFGYGAAVCTAESVMAAWRLARSDGADYVQQAVDAAERMKRNLLRYVTVM